MKEFARNCEGATAVEFAIVVVPVLLLLLGIVDFSILTWRVANLDHAAIELHGSIRQGIAAAGTYRQIFCDASGALVSCDPDALSLRVAPLDNIASDVMSSGYAVVQGQPFIIQAQYKHSFLIPFIDQMIPGESVETSLVLYGAVD